MDYIKKNITIRLYRISVKRIWFVLFPISLSVCFHIGIMMYLGSDSNYADPSFLLNSYIYFAIRILSIFTAILQVINNRKGKTENSLKNKKTILLQFIFSLTLFIYCNCYFPPVGTGINAYSPDFITKTIYNLQFIPIFIVGSLLISLADFVPFVPFVHNIMPVFYGCIHWSISYALVGFFTTYYFLNKLITLIKAVQKNDKEKFYA